MDVMNDEDEDGEKLQWWVVMKMERRAMLVHLCIKRRRRDKEVAYLENKKRKATQTF